MLTDIHKGSDKDSLKEVDGREGDTLRRVEILTGSGRRRRWSDEAKTRIVAESFEPDVSVSAVARRYDLSSGLLFLWRRQFAGRRPGRVAPEPDFVPVTIAPAANASDERAPASITIEIGDIRIKVAGRVDGATLREVMMAIRTSR